MKHQFYKRINTLVALVLFIFLLPWQPVSAQLADWKPAGSTDFPIHRTGIFYVGNGRISQFAFDPNNSRNMMAVSAGGGLFSSIDEGLHWQPVPGMDKIPVACATICIDHTNSNTIYIGTGDPDYYGAGNGVWKSTDGGLTFNQSGLNGQLVLQIIQDPANPASFAAATSAGIFKTTDGGQTWTQALLTTIVSGTPVTVPLSGIFADMKKNAAPSSRILYAATAELTAVFYRSTDFGDHWEKITNGITSVPQLYIQSGGRIGVTKADPNRVYLFWNGGLGMIYMSTDGGNSFQLRKAEGPPNLVGYEFGNNTGSGQGNYNSAFLADNSNPDRLWYYAQTMSVSEDGGLSFSLLRPNGSGIHTDSKMMAQNPDDPNKLWASNDGGLWFSSDRGANWLPRGNGLFTYEVSWNAGKGSRTRSDMMQIGTQDNGCISMHDYTWYTMWSSDDYIPREFDYLPEGGNIYYPGATINRKNTFSYYEQNLGVPVPVIHGIIFNRKEKDLSYIFDHSPGSKIFRTQNLSAALPSWSPVTTLSGTAIAMNSPIADPDRLYILTSNGQFLYSSNARSANPAFVSVAMPVPAVGIGSIATIANDADKIYMAVNEKVYYSRNGGASWDDITYNLPNVYHKRILAEDYGGSSELVFIATSNAVYYKKAGQTAWTIYTTGLPVRLGPVDFSMYDDSTGNARLRYAARGRGIYETGFGNLRPLEAIIDMPDTSTLSCSSGTINVHEVSNGKLHTPITYAWSFPGGNPSSSTDAAPQVSYPATGNYSISLTITDALNNRSTSTVSRFIQKIRCEADTVPGHALLPAMGHSYAVTDPLDFGVTNTVTISAWLKTDRIQQENTGIMATNYWPGCGLLLKDNNKLGFFWEGRYLDLESGLQLPPDNRWHHVAVVTGATKATLYLDGFPSTLDNLINNPLPLNTTWCIGSFNQDPDKTFLGLIDELCVYTRELSTAEIREQMNLTKNNGIIDPSLKVYYQFNDYGRTVFNKAGTGNALMYGKSSRVKSTAPVGGGVAQTLTVNNSGPVLFDRTGLQLDYPAAASYPIGPVVATRLHVSPDDSAAVHCLPSPKLHYWIVRSYGTNTLANPLTGITFSATDGVTPIHTVNPSAVNLYRREANDEGHTWGNSIAAASTVNSTGSMVSVRFNTAVNNTGFAQLMLGSALPVTQLNLTGQNENNLTALLQWTVAGELPGVNYTVEHSTDGILFTPVGTVAGTRAAAYQLRHLHPVVGLNHYRLAIKDNNGRVTYSNIVTLKFETVPLQFVLAPVPAESNISLSLNKPAGTDLELRLMNAAGQMLQKYKLANGITRQQIDMARYNSGVYVLQVYDEKGEQLFKQQFSKINRAP